MKQINNPFVQVYSIVDGIVRVFLTANDVKINSYLTEKKMAEYCEESYISKVNSHAYTIGKKNYVNSNFCSICSTV